MPKRYDPASGQYKAYDVSGGAGARGGGRPSERDEWESECDPSLLGSVDPFAASGDGSAPTSAEVDPLAAAMAGGKTSSSDDPLMANDPFACGSCK